MKTIGNANVHDAALTLGDLSEGSIVRLKACYDTGEFFCFVSCILMMFFFFFFFSLLAAQHASKKIAQKFVRDYDCDLDCSPDLLVR